MVVPFFSLQSPTVYFTFERSWPSRGLMVTHPITRSLNRFRDGSYRLAQCKKEIRMCMTSGACLTRQTYQWRHIRVKAPGRGTNAQSRCTTQRSRVLHMLLPQSKYYCCKLSVEAPASRDLSNGQIQWGHIFIRMIPSYSGQDGPRHA